MGPELSSQFAALGVCFYLLSTALPFGYRWDVPLIALCVISGVLAGSSFLAKTGAGSQLLLPLLVFLASIGLSTLVSEDVGRNLRVSASLLPVVLLFYLISEKFSCPRHVRFLYLTFSLLGLGFGSLLLLAAWQHTRMGPSAWVTLVGSSLLIVPNDVTFIALTVPLSLTLLRDNSGKWIVALAVVSVLISGYVVCLFQSRIALLTLVGSVVCFAVLVRPQLALLSCVSTAAAVLIFDGLNHFQLILKFANPFAWTQRIPLWLAASSMFLDAPLLGHGPQTFVLYYRQYLDHLVLPNWVTPDPRVTSWPHNLFLEILAEQGIVGMLAFGFLLYSGIGLASRLWRSRIEQTRTLGSGALACLLAFCVSAMFELSLTRQWVILLLFTLLGVISRLSL
jgi:O-antigen ligase